MKKPSITMTQRQSRAANLLLISMVAIIALLPETSMAATTGTDFQALYDFIYNAATGYLGRAIALVGGLIGLAFGAINGKIILALSGILLAVFGVLGPTIINTIFASAVI